MSLNARVTRCLADLALAYSAPRQMAFIRSFAGRLLITTAFLFGVDYMDMREDAESADWDITAIRAAPHPDYKALGGTVYFTLIAPAVVAVYRFVGILCLQALFFTRIARSRRFYHQRFSGALLI